LLYTCRELQKDQELHPCSSVNQLRRFLREHVIAAGEFKVAEAPLLRTDIRLLQKADSATPFDIFVNYSEKNRLLALTDSGHQLKITKKQKSEIESRLNDARKVFTASSQLKADVEEAVAIPLARLKEFLHCPAEAALKRHLGLFDEEEIEPADAEPVYTDYLVESQLMKLAQKRFIAASLATSVETAHKNWRQQFRQLYEEWRLRGRTPDGAFGQVNRARFEQQLQETLEGPTGLVAFLQARNDAAFCGPVLLGESSMPIKPRCRLPSLTLATGNSESMPSCQVSLTGALPLVWRSPIAIDVLVLTNKKEDKVPPDQLSAPLLEPALFYLALRSDPQPGHSARREWIGDRIFRIHVTHKAGTHCISFLPEDCTPDEAGNYLLALASDLLDRSSCDLLPFDLIREKELREAFQSAESWPADKRVEYVRSIEEAYEDDQETPTGKKYYPMNLLRIVRPRVPLDAFDKVRRRFQLLDRGPARNR
jgi:hypothetical protein